jgi:hypothetical protein
MFLIAVAEGENHISEVHDAVRPFTSQEYIFTAIEEKTKFWLMTNLTHSFLMYLFYASTCFEQQVLIIRKAKLY